MINLKSTLLVSAAALGLTACGGPGETGQTGAGDAASAPPSARMDTPPPSREGLAAGIHDAGVAAWNLELIANHPSPPGFSGVEVIEGSADTGRPSAYQDDAPPAAEDAEGEAGGDEDQADAEADTEAAERAAMRARIFDVLAVANSDLAFSGDLVFMGNFHGVNAFDVSDPADPQHVLSIVCPGGQGDVSIHGNLLFMSVEENRARLDCGGGGVEGEASAERFRGVRIFDISDLDDPLQVAAVQTCRGSHTHTFVPHPTDPDTAYIYVQGTGAVRPAEELAMCSGGEPDENPETALYSIDVIEVPLSAPQEARIVNRPRIFADPETGEIAGLWQAAGDGDGDGPRSSTTNQCHDITVYPEFDLAAGACSGNGILLDISDPANPVRIADLADPAMAYWHSATFSNDAGKIVFTDEWGGGLGARCRPWDPTNWGANVIATVQDGALVQHAYFKIPNEQTEQENCVAHNGSLVPVPGRDLFVQSWYSGGISVMDFTDPDNPFEIAYFDRGPVDAENLYLAGNWAAYWHNGHIYAPEIVRGLDVLSLLPSAHLSEAELAAAQLIRFDEANTQTQMHAEWPAEPVVARAYLDQLGRGNRLDARLAARAAREIARWEDGRARRGRMTRLASELDAAAATAPAPDAGRMAALARILEQAG